MKATFVLAFIWSVAAFGFFVQAKPQQQSNGFSVSDNGDYQYDQYGDYSDDGEDYSDDDIHNEEEIVDVPKFVTKGSTFTFDEGTTIRLPCYVDKLPKHFVMMWNRAQSSSGESLIVMDDRVVVDDKRMSVAINKEGSDQGSTLTVRVATAADAGHYICQLASSDKDKIKHTVIIRAKPTISKNPANGLLLATKGDTVSLSCNGEGSPKPEITWTRVGKTMPDGRASMSGSELTFMNVNRRHSGTYVCRADNGFSVAAEDKITVDVEYRPEVEVEEVFIHAKTGNQVELVCKVHAHPVAVVKWFKNSMALTNDSASLEKIKNRHTLNIARLTDKDFGNYTCRAENRMGVDSRVIEISGKAAPAEFTSSPQGYEPNKFLVEWTVQSYSPVVEFLLRYRSHADSEWREIKVAPHPTNGMTYAGKNSLSGLESAGQYEAHVLTLNGEGWSRASKNFQFATFGAEPLTDAALSSARSLTFLPMLWSLVVAVLVVRHF